MFITSFFQGTSNQVSTVSVIDFPMSIVELATWFYHMVTHMFLSGAQRIKIIWVYEAYVVAAGPFCIVLGNSPSNALEAGDVGWISWRRKWQSAPVFSPGKSHGQRSLAG